MTTFDKGDRVSIEGLVVGESVNWVDIKLFDNLYDPTPATIIAKSSVKLVKKATPPIPTGGALISIPGGGRAFVARDGSITWASGVKSTFSWAEVVGMDGFVVLA